MRIWVAKSKEVANLMLNWRKHQDDDPDAPRYDCWTSCGKQDRPWPWWTQSSWPTNLKVKKTAPVLMQPTTLLSSQYSSSSVLWMEIYLPLKYHQDVIEILEGVGNISPSQDYSSTSAPLHAQRVREKSDLTVAWPSWPQLTSVHRPRHNLLKLRRRQSRNRPRPTSRDSEPWWSSWTQ